MVAYNAEVTIERAINSVLEQTFKDFELIVVDDGSRDSTQKIVAEYADRDPRIRLLVQPNSGVGQARQNGLEKAIGMYVIHADSDDWVERDWLELLYQKAIQSDADVVICDYCEHREDGVFDYHQVYEERGPESLIEALLTLRIHSALWNKLISNEFYKRNGISFLKGLNYGEDMYVLIRVFSHNPRVAFVPKVLYHYDKTPSASLTNNRYKIDISQRLLLINSVSEYVPVQDQKALDDFIANVAYNALFLKKKYCANYKKAFMPFKDQIEKSSLSRFKKKLVLLRLKGIRVPVLFIRKLHVLLNNLIRGNFSELFKEA